MRYSRLIVAVFALSSIISYSQSQLLEKNVFRPHMVGNMRYPISLTMLCWGFDSSCNVLHLTTRPLRRFSIKKMHLWNSAGRQSCLPKQHVLSESLHQLQTVQARSVPPSLKTALSTAIRIALNIFTINVKAHILA